MQLKYLDVRHHVFDFLFTSYEQLARKPVDCKLINIPGRDHSMIANCSSYIGCMYKYIK